MCTCSASIDDDDYFELMLRNVWHISGGQGWAANTTCKRVLVTHEDNTMSVQEITDDFDVDGAQGCGVAAKLRCTVGLLLVAFVCGSVGYESRLR